MKTIKIIGVGGNAGQLAYRCLKDHYNIVGEDSSQWGKLIMPCSEGEADMTLAVPDSRVKLNSFKPDNKQIALCQDKAKCAEILGDLAPTTYWVRDTEGAGGKGAQMASEYLPGRNVSVEVCFHNDQIVGVFAKERLSYSISGSKEPTHQFGTSFVSKCIEYGDFMDSVFSALQKIVDHTGAERHGFYGIDFKENKDGQFKITEINAGRLLTASYCYYYLTEYNLLRAGVAKFLGDDYTLGEYPLNKLLIRSMDMEPKLLEDKCAS